MMTNIRSEDSCCVIDAAAIICPAAEVALDLSANFRSESPAAVSFSEERNAMTNSFSADSSESVAVAASCSEASSAMTNSFSEGRFVDPTNQSVSVVTPAAGRDTSNKIAVVVRRPSCQSVRCDFCCEVRPRALDSGPVVVGFCWK